ncbi:MAG: DUF3800 domain-containing protein [Rhodoblastus sp.]|nr:DUF3800 domain-containing protein [Rhodoblastus sp.]
MHLVYIDDSKDGRDVCFSAIAFPAADWIAALEHLTGLRRAMRASDGIYVTKEMHATDWLAGRGHIAPFFVPKGARARLFDYFLTGITMLPNVQIFSAHSPFDAEEQLFERLLNRIQMNMSISGSRALIISDNGKNYDKMVRRMRRFNFIPSRFGGARNVPLDRIIEDIVYRDSAKSFFIQAADACAFSLLRFRKPTPKALKYGFNQSFLLLDRSLVKSANRSDPYGIVRA